MIYYDLEEVLLKVDRMFCEERYIVARRYLLEILEDEPDCGQVHFKLGWLYWARLDDFVKAEEHFRLAIKFSPDYPLTYYNYALFLNSVADAKGLRELLAKAMSVRSVSRFFIHNELAKSHEINGEYAEALEQYRLASDHASMVHEADQARSNLNRIKQKTHDSFIRSEYHSEAHS